MSYKLEKPYTEIERADFIVLHNHQNNRKIEETETALFALEDNEVMVDGQPQINPDYENERNQQQIIENQEEIEKKINYLQNLSIKYMLNEDKKAVEIIKNIISGLQ